MLPVMLLRAMRSMMLLGAPAVVAMAMLASPGLYALRLHSTTKATARSLPHKSIPSLARGRTTDTCIATPRDVASFSPNVPLCLVKIRYRLASTVQAFSERRGVAVTCTFDIPLSGRSATGRRRYRYDARPVSERLAKPRLSESHA